MKTNRKKVLSISVGILIILSTFIPIYVVYRSRDQRTKHEPIIIWRDEDFRNFDFVGDGSKENPYLIENLDITIDTKYSISIKNTFKYFIIRNCYLEANDTGIHLDNVAEGTAIVSNNLCNNNEIGMKISNSNSLIISNNTCSNNKGSAAGGIILLDSSYCNVTNNLCIDNELYGIKLEETNSCYLYNNTCNNNIGTLQGAGISVFQSLNTVLESNICNSNRRYGIQISVSDSSTLRNNTCEDNYQAGINVISSDYCIIENNNLFRNKNWFERDSHGLVLYHSSFCNVTENTIGLNIGNGIFIEDSPNCNIIDNLIYNQTGYDELLYSKYSNYFGYAIYSYSSDNASILDNQCFNNFGSCWVDSSQFVNISSNIFLNGVNYTIEISGCNNLSLEYNILSENIEGINIYETDSSSVIFNLIQETESYGLSLLSNSSSNVIHHNSFIDNNLGGSSQGYDEGTGNLWFDNITKEGNFWSDWSGSGNYSIDGPSNSQDPYCLSENPLEILLCAKINYANILGKSMSYCAKNNFGYEHYYVMLLFFSLTLSILLKSRKEHIEIY